MPDEKQAPLCVYKAVVDPTPLCVYKACCWDASDLYTALRLACHTYVRCTSPKPLAIVLPPLSLHAWAFAPIESQHAHNTDATESESRVAAWSRVAACARSRVAAASARASAASYRSMRANEHPCDLHCGDASSACLAHVVMRRLVLSHTCGVVLSSLRGLELGKPQVLRCLGAFYSNKPGASIIAGPCVIIAGP